MSMSPRYRRALRSLACAFALGAAAPALAQEGKLPEPLVYLRDVDPSILQDIRYAGADNFTGRRVPGYLAAECILLGDVAEALSRVQKALAPRRLSLKVYDCYRPPRAVRAFVDWLQRGEVDPSLKRYHPKLERNELIGLGYIAAVSRHSLGDTVDLTLVKLPEAKVPDFDRAKAYGTCTGPVEERSPDSGVDMGTGFDCFDPLSHTEAAGIAPAQRRWRRALVEAMAQEGFQNYRKEWWHFTYMPSRRGPAFSVPIVPRRPEDARSKKRADPVPGPPDARAKSGQ
jgi:D-alanyl-D-alanine dipeptidase